MMEKFRNKNNYVRIKSKKRKKKKYLVVESKNRAKVLFIIINIVVFLILILSVIFYNFRKLNSFTDKVFNWAPAGDKIKTKWGKNLDWKNVWPEYPRPQLERKQWLNLNGPWYYSIKTQDSPKMGKPDGKILVPFPIESSLSGVMRGVTENDTIWYEKEFEIPSEWKDMDILLHFGAVDWKCTVYINEDKVGEHSGGYSPFFFDITSKLKKGINKITLKVYDPTNKGYQPVGKQRLKPRKIWYTSISGIWQTVWLEPVNKIYFTKLEINNNFDDKEIKITFKLNVDTKLTITVKVFYNEAEIQIVKGDSNQEIIIKLSDENFYPWTPSKPNLYTIKAELYNNDGKFIDSINSYTSIRKIEQRKDSTGNYRIYLNNNPLFNMGTLDQGYWPDGLYTPPSEEAMIYDIKKLKDLGFNTIRKHMKIESSRYYFACDKIGMLLWQDMPSGDFGKNHWEPNMPDQGTDVERSQESKDNFYQEWGEIIENFKFFQCIIVWVTFNEAWGQFETEKVVEFTSKMDPLRLINPASGGNHRKCGHFLDLHHYPNPEQSFKVDSVINVLGEFGGIGLKIEGHIWEDNNWGYKVVDNKENLSQQYAKYIDDLIKFIDTGFSSAIYTQTTDVESEINGLITYDRAEVKAIEETFKASNEKVINSLK